MNKQRKEDLATKTSLQIIEHILEEQNGFTPEEIKKDKLAEDCMGSVLYQRIYDSIYKLCGKQ